MRFVPVVAGFRVKLYGQLVKQVKQPLHRFNGKRCLAVQDKL
jgi:hypothetical protein